MAASPTFELSDEEATGPRRKERSSIEVDGTWDIETEGWDTFVCGAIVEPGAKDPIRVFSWQEEESFVDALLERPRTLWAHNGGRFDTLWLLGHVWRRGLKGKIGLSGSSIASLEVDGAIFRDSARLAPMTLDKFAQIGSVPKVATGLPCVCKGPRACGGYCSISRDMPRKLYGQLVDYMVQDCRALQSALEALCTIAEREDIDLRPTIGACAWATVMRGGVEKADWGDGVNVTRAYEHTRMGYYGGRTQVFRPVSEAGYHYDINSAYPAALANLKLPVGEREEIEGHAASRAYANGKLGVFRASVYVPQRLFVPPLPVRTRARIAFPVGLVGGWWTGLELQAAQSVGAVIRRIDQGVVWSSGEMVLAAFCRRIWALRDAAGPKTALGAWFKWLANSLTGKLATKPETESIVVDPTKITACPASTDCDRGRQTCKHRECCTRRCTGLCGVTKPIAANFPVFSVKWPRLSSCSHVEWAAYLTSYTRAHVLRFAGSGEDAVYCDTDSLRCEKERKRYVGTNLGDWKLEYRYRQFFALAPKTYEDWDAGTGEVHAAAKGIPDAVRNFIDLKDGKKVTNDRGVNTFKRALQVGDIFKRRHLPREIRSDGKHFGDRVLGRDGRTYPRTAKQINETMWELG